MLATIYIHLFIGVVGGRPKSSQQILFLTVAEGAVGMSSRYFWITVDTFFGGDTFWILTDIYDTQLKKTRGRGQV